MIAHYHIIAYFKDMLFFYSAVFSLAVTTLLGDIYDDQYRNTMMTYFVNNFEYLPDRSLISLYTY